MILIELRKMIDILIDTGMSETNSLIGRIERAMYIGSDVSTIVKLSKLPEVELPMKLVVLILVDGYIMSLTWIVKPEKC